MNTQHKPGERGFSLIELMVVIAIIAIMAALLLPAVQNAMLKSQALAVGSDGRQIWTALYTENSEREAGGEMSVWPQGNAYANSTEFFRDCIAKQWLGERFTFQYMGAPGLPRAKTVDPQAFTGENNAWCVVVGVNASTHDDTPFLFTRNFGTEGAGGSLADINALNPAAAPFGKHYGVIVTAGGAIRIVRPKDSPERLQELFNPYGEQLAYIRP